MKNWYSLNDYPSRFVPTPFQRLITHGCNHYDTRSVWWMKATSRLSQRSLIYNLQLRTNAFFKHKTIAPSGFDLVSVPLHYLRKYTFPLLCSRNLKLGREFPLHFILASFNQSVLSLSSREERQTDKQKATSYHSL